MTEGCTFYMFTAKWFVCIWHNKTQQWTWTSAFRINIRSTQEIRLAFVQCYVYFAKCCQWIVREEDEECPTAAWKSIVILAVGLAVSIAIMWHNYKMPESMFSRIRKASQSCQRQSFNILTLLTTQPHLQIRLQLLYNHCAQWHYHEHCKLYLKTGFKLQFTNRRCRWKISILRSP